MHDRLSGFPTDSSLLGLNSLALLVDTDSWVVSYTYNGWWFDAFKQNRWD